MDQPDRRAGHAGVNGAGLDEDTLTRAYRHGLDSRGRFADRPFDEVRTWLRESWEGKGEGPEWTRVEPIVRSGYEHRKGADLDVAADLGPEALERFPDRHVSGGMMEGPRSHAQPAEQLGTGERSEDEPAGERGPAGAEQLPDGDAGVGERRPEGG